VVKSRYWAGNSCYSVDINNKLEFDLDFIYQEMKRNQNRFIENQQAANIPSVSKTDVEKFELVTPSYTEQVKIGYLFKKLDSLIALHQRKQKMLENITKTIKNRLLCHKGEKMNFNNELDFEKALITLLFDKGWEKNVLKYKTEEDLINNWASILYENNREIDKLNDYPLTRTEMQQIIDQINVLKTPLKLNGFINGKEVAIKRDNPDDVAHLGKEVRLKIYDRQEIAAGQSRYQIAEQPRFKAKSALLNDRRGDFMLLINGMPVIHVELKKSNVSINQATNQIEKYAHEGVFTGLFSLVQVFVAMTPEETVYFANPGPDGNFNKDFYFHWADFNNEPMNDWKSIAEHLISIPMAHQLIGFYTVADDTDGILKVMRSYQYYAASAISDKVAKTKWGEKNIRGGYVWHTTGSGKTLTSFKSAQLIANSKDADKVVFLMDRIELGTQSLLEYRGFASDNETVQSTENTGVLITRLKSDNADDTLIVTSIQKMSRIKEDGAVNDQDIKTINSKRLVFIIDECHRDTFGEMLSTIKKTFPLAIFFGFTGTPIHDENKKKMNTTSDIFGGELHRYSIADGIRDGNVLGFDPYMVNTFKERELRKKIALEKAKAETEEEALSSPEKSKIYYYFMRLPMENRIVNNKQVLGLESYIPKSQYLTDTHKNEVVKDILESFTTLSNNGQFHALFATSSIPEAIEYYRLFKSTGTKLKIAALFDQNIDNSDGAIFKEDAVIEMLDDYNERYNQTFTIPTYQKYKKDIQLRLAHKKYYRGIENSPEKQLDILIVVDQMLTGFDSKWINTLYLDKIMRYESIIQAFSRTNRLFDKVLKPFGVIKYYRRPYLMKQYIEEAVKLYSGDKPLGLFVDKLPENLIAMNEIYGDIVTVFTSSGVENFSKLPDETEARAKFASLFKELNKHLEAAKIQGFVWTKLDYDGIKLDFDENKYLILALRYKELLSPIGPGGNPPEVPYDVEGYLTEISTEDIDTNYMNSKFKKYLKELNTDKAEEALNELHKTFASLSQEEQKYAYQFIRDIQSGNIKPDENKSFRDYITEYQVNAKNDQIHIFAYTFGLDEIKLRKFMKANVTPQDINAYGKFDELKNTADKTKAKRYFEQKEGVSIPPFKALIKLDAYLRKFIFEGGFDIEIPDEK
jgi:type I restriction enzyme, R subunit